MDENATQAWLLCVELINKAKAEFVTQAIETLRREVQNKNIDIHGQTMAPPEASNEAEREEIVLNKIMGEYGSIKDTYESYMSQKQQTDQIDYATVERMEKLRKFLLSLEKISILMHYSRMCDEWMNDVSMEVKAKNPSEILAKTTINDTTRKEIIDFILKNKEIATNEIFTNEEMRIFKDASIILYKGQ